jgi:hypothetical protein
MSTTTWPTSERRPLTVAALLSPAVQGRLLHSTAAQPLPPLIMPGRWRVPVGVVMVVMAGCEPAVSILESVHID